MHLLYNHCMRKFKQSIIDFANLEVQLGFLNKTVDSSKLFYDI